MTRCLKKCDLIFAACCCAFMAQANPADQWVATDGAGRILPTHAEVGDVRPVITLDVAATATARAGLPDDPVLDGVNLIPFLTGKNRGAPHEALYWRWLGQSAVRKGRWKYLRSDHREYLFDMEMISRKPPTCFRLIRKLQRPCMPNSRSGPGRCSRQASGP